MLPRAAEGEAMNWLEQMDSEVEAEAQKLKGVRRAKIEAALLLIGLGFLMGCVFTYWAHDLLEQWL